MSLPAIAAQKRIEGLTVSTPPPHRYDFKMEKGKGIPVCEAYVKRLRVTDFRTLPHCDRPENNSIAGFSLLKRVPLTRAETFKLYRSVEGWLFLGDPGLGKRPGDTSAQWAADTQADAVENKLHINPPPLPYYYRFDPRIDIDNDGRPDEVVVYKQTGLRCGDVYRDSTPTVAATYLVVLNDRGEVDYARTRDLLEWPSPELAVKPAPTDPVRLMAHTFGIFEFNGTYYIDGFFPNERKGTTDLLGVFERKARQTIELCEIRWYDRSAR